MTNPAPENCPRCNSEQKFAVLLEDTGEGILRQYLRCNMCRWDRTIGYTTPMIELATKRLRQWQQRHEYEVRSHGAATTTTVNKTDRVRDQVIGLRRQLNERLAATHQRSA